MLSKWDIASSIVPYQAGSSAQLILEFRIFGLDRSVPSLTQGTGFSRGILQRRDKTLERFWLEVVRVVGTSLRLRLTGGFGPGLTKRGGIQCVHVHFVFRC